MESNLKLMHPVSKIKFEIDYKAKINRTCLDVVFID